MINCNCGFVNMHGTIDGLMTEFLFIVDALKKNFSESLGDEKMAETFLKKAFDDGLTGVEELVKKIDESESEEK